MRISRVVLRQKSREIILQGMIHIAPKKLYEVLQRDVNWAVSNKYQVFFEGLREEDQPEQASTSNESKIRKLLYLLDFDTAFSGDLSISLQEENIIYPKDAINADITFTELTQQLDRNGFKCGFLLWLFQSTDDEEKKEIEKAMKKEFAGHHGLNAQMNDGDGLFGRLVKWFFLRKAMPIIMDYRNEVAIAKIRECLNDRNIFVHYGEAHIKGLVYLLRKDGWVIKETTYTDLAEFC